MNTKLEIMKEGTSLAAQIKWQKKVIGNQLEIIKDQREEIGIAAARIKKLEATLKRYELSSNIREKQFGEKRMRILELEDRLISKEKERDYWEQDRNEINSMWTDRYNQIKGSMALESSKSIDSLELKDERIKELEEELRLCNLHLKELLTK